MTMLVSNIHAQGLQAFHFLLHNSLGQTELGNAVHQNAAGKVQGFVYGNLIAQLGQVAGTVRPEGPQPITATLWPFGSGLAAGVWTFYGASQPQSAPGGQCRRVRP